MATRNRDFRAEYARRIERGLTKGLSRSQARGHPRGTEAARTLSSGAETYNRQLEDGFRLIRDGRTLSSAAREVHASPERLRAYLQMQKIAEKRGRRWVPLPDQRPRRMLMYSDGQLARVKVDPSVASLVGSYMGQVSRFLETNDPSGLGIFHGHGITDLRGTFHPFETDPNALYRLANTGQQSFEQIYRIIL